MHDCMFFKLYLQTGINKVHSFIHSMAILDRKKSESSTIYWAQDNGIEML